MDAAEEKEEGEAACDAKGKETPSLALKEPQSY